VDYANKVQDLFSPSTSGKQPMAGQKGAQPERLGDYKASP